MVGSSRKGNQSIKADTIGFLRDSALITDVDGNPALTSKGEMFLNHLESFKGQSPSSSLGPASLDGSTSTEETSQQ